MFRSSSFERAVGWVVLYCLVSGRCDLAIRQGMRREIRAWGEQMLGFLTTFGELEERGV